MNKSWQMRVFGPPLNNNYAQDFFSITISSRFLTRDHHNRSKSQNRLKFEVSRITLKSKQSKRRAISRNQNIKVHSVSSCLDLLIFLWSIPFKGMFNQPFQTTPQQATLNWEATKNIRKAAQRTILNSPRWRMMI